MRICLLGNSTGSIDEGMKNITFNISKELSKKHELLVLNPLNVFSLHLWQSIKEFNPDIVHYIPGPSINSFIIVKLISLYLKYLNNRSTKFVMSAPFPKLSAISKEIIRLFKPDLMIVQSKSTEKIFAKRGFKTILLPLSGVDVKKFRPVKENTKYKLREKYGVNADRFVVLHIGHIKEGRNLQILKKIQTKNNNVQVVIVGSTSTEIEKKIYRELVDGGCIVITKYIHNIEEIYQLSDCYVFPTVNKLNSIELPLSVLEAMACNLPVVSTKFGALPEYFTEGNGLIFVKNCDQILEIVSNLRETNKDVDTRKKVIHFSWENISKKLVKIYEELLG